MDPNKIMKEMARMQADLEKAQEELAGVVVEGTSGGGAVSIKLTGAGEVADVKIDSSAVDVQDPTFLDDLVKAALSDALRRSSELAASRLGGLTGNLGLPGTGG